MLRGAKFEKNIIQRDKKTTEVYDKLQKEVKPQIDAQLKKLKAIGENAAIKGNVTNVAIDNKNFYIEYSKDSMVNVAAVVDGTRNLGLSKGDIKLASNIIKFYDKGVEVKTQEDGKRNYVDISDGSGFEVVFPTTLGELHLLIFHNIENYDQVQVKVEDSEMWNKLQEMGEIVGKDCLFGGMSVGEAVKNGSFSRSRISEIIKPIGEYKSSETLSWVNRLQNKKPISVVRS